MNEYLNKKITIKTAVSIPSTKKIKALQNSPPNTCTVMGTERVKLSLTLIKSHPLLPLHFYSLSYLLPIRLHQPLLRRGAPLFPPQNRGFTCSAPPLQTSKAKPHLQQTRAGPVLPHSIQRSSSRLPSSLPYREIAKRSRFLPILDVFFCSDGKAGTYHKFSLLIGISPA